MMVDPDRAMDLVLLAARRLSPCNVPLREACGLTLAEPIHAKDNHPPFCRALVDGFAVRAADAGATVRVLGELSAGQTTLTKVTPGHCFEIMTGAPCPPGTEAIVPLEEVVQSGDRITLPSKVLPGQYIAPEGSECPTGQPVLRDGQTITSLMVAVLASVGRDSVAAIPRPSLAVITTGAEVVPHRQAPPPGKIRDSNGPMLAAMACDLGIPDPFRAHVPDRMESILQVLGQVADRDIVLFSGGVSAGKYDLVPEAVQRYGAELVFHRVGQKPGKPLLLAARDGQLLFGLPGNPLGCHFSFHRYVSAAIRQMDGRPSTTVSLTGQLAGPVRPDPVRTSYVPSRAERSEDSAGHWRIQPLRSKTSADVFGASEANCYARVPPGADEVAIGETVPFTMIRDASQPI
jgi:molybdopterin molybdotransferase